MNAILLVIDAFDQKRIEETDYRITPNLERLLKHGVKFTNVFSQSPYTEAAVMGLYAGQNTLDNGGYLYRYGRAKKTIFEVFKEAGFEVFCNNHIPQIYPCSQRRGIDYLIYERPYDFDVLWRYRLQYFSAIFKEGRLSKNDLKAITAFVDDNFNEAKSFLNDLAEDNESVQLIKKYDEEYDFNAAKDYLDSEYRVFSQNKEEYCTEILSQGKSHSFFQTPSFKMGRFHLSDQMEQFHNREIKKFCKKILRKNIGRCIFKNGDFYKSIFKNIKLLFKKNGFESFLKGAYMTKNSLVMTHIKERYGKSAKNLKEQPTFNSLSNNFFDWLSNRSDKTKPFFANIHVDDVHFPEIFYSFDCDDVGLVKNELEIANDTMKRITGKGTVIHDLSLSYADYHIGLFVDKLEKMGLMDDTIVFVTADHGFSYSGYPIRQKDINTYYLENFKIPFYVFGNSFEKKIIDSKLSSLDIPFTICDLLGLKTPGSYKGINGFEGKRDIRFIEYCGGGCPDLDRREIMLACFSNEKMLCFRLRLNEEFGWNKVSEVYDLVADKLQKKNLVKKFVHTDYFQLFEAAKKRFDEIKQDNQHPIVYPCSEKC